MNQLRQMLDALWRESDNYYASAAVSHNLPTQQDSLIPLSKVSNSLVWFEQCQFHRPVI
jgi:hypothetical protein